MSNLVWPWRPLGWGQMHWTQETLMWIGQTISLHKMTHYKISEKWFGPQTPARLHTAALSEVGWVAKHCTWVRVPEFPNTIFPKRKKRSLVFTNYKQEHLKHKQYHNVTLRRILEQQSNLLICEHNTFTGRLSGKLQLLWALITKYIKCTVIKLFLVDVVIHYSEDYHTFMTQLWK